MIQPESGRAGEISGNLRDLDYGFPNSSVNLQQHNWFLMMLCYVIGMQSYFDPTKRNIKMFSVSLS